MTLMNDPRFAAHGITRTPEGERPLVKSSSKEAFSKNVSTEYKALKAKGVSSKKAQEQAVAVAYATQKAAKKKGK